MPIEKTNYLLSQLPISDLEFIRPHLHRFDLIQGDVLVEQGKPADYVYFPHSGLLSLVVHLKDSDGVEAVMVGSDGILGPTTAMANPPSNNETVVQLSGNSSRLSVSMYKEVHAQSAGVRSLGRPL